MKKHLTLFLFVCSLVLAFPAAQAQRGVFIQNPSSDNFGNNTLTVQLYPLFFHGYGIEYSRNLYRQKHYLKVNGVCYTAGNRKTGRQTAMREMLGGEAGVYHQYNYFELPKVGFRTYFQWGFNYTYLDIENVAAAKTHIEKLGLNVVVGFRQNIAKPLYFDFYIGYGQRWLLDRVVDNTGVAPQVENKAAREPLYNKNMFDYGHGGAMLVVGLNVGFLF